MERVWSSRLRWRLRGAWIGPLLVVAVIVDALLLTELPISGEGPQLLGGLLLAVFFNLVAVAAVAPFLGMLVRRRRPDLPAFLARDLAAAALAVLIAATLLTLGLQHRGEVQANRDAMREAVARGQAWIGAQADAPAEVRRHVQLADVIPIVEGSVYRVCVVRPSDARKAFCAVVDLEAEPPGDVRGAGTEPNASFNAGRW